MKSQEVKKIDQKSQQILSNYLKKGNSLILGLSGGPDSMFLFHQLINFQKNTPCKIIATHLNHMIRKKQADMDQEYLENIVKKLENPQIIYESKKIDIKKLSKKNKTSIEEEGTNQRYKFFKQQAKKYQTKYILTAHHANDNLESILMNFVRGTGLVGLSGMQEIQSLNPNLFLLRPLLNFSKNEILNWLKFHKIKYLKDHTNEDTKYRRNFLRHKILPHLLELNPNLAKTASHTSQQIRQTQDYLDKQAQSWIKRNSLNKSITRLNAKSFRKTHEILQKNILRQIHKIHIGHTKNLESIHIDEVLKIINQNIGNKQKKLGKIQISLKRNIIFIQYRNNL
ncbi:tRNA lysidine(34) synthetase TilS [Patescibacteria group bacterium]